MRARSLVAACALLLALGSAGAAAAQDGGSWQARAEGSRLGVEMDWWPTERFHAVTWGLVGQIEVADTVYLDFDVPWAGYFPDGDDARAVLGNLTFGVHWADKLTPNLAMFAGGTLTLPTLITGEASLRDRDDFINYLLKVNAASTRAFVDLHRFFPDFVALRPRLGLEVRILPALRYRGDLTPMTLFPVGDTVDDVELVIEHGSEIEGRTASGVGGGLRFQAAMIATQLDGDDSLQTALEPYFIYDPTEGFYLRAGVLVALDERAGFGFDEGKLATIRLSLGGKW